MKAAWPPREGAIDRILARSRRGGPAMGDFHLSPNLLDIDKGVGTSVLTDIDGQVRDAARNLGAHEFTAPLDCVAISESATGSINAVTLFTAVITPHTATRPVTYVWQATGQLPVTHTVARFSATVSFTWSVTGTYHITVSSSDVGGNSSAIYTTTIYVAPSSLAILGPSIGLIGNTYTLTAGVLPLTATQPITFVWQATGQAAVTHTVISNSDEAGFIWNVAGPQAITVTARNMGGTVSISPKITTKNPAPSLTSINPILATASGPTLTLTVMGTNFIATSIVRWNGTARATAFITNSQLQATILTADVKTAGIANVTVFNPAPGGGESNAALITTINNPVYLPLVQR